MSSKVEEALELIKGMTVLEVSQLVKVLQEEFGVSPVAAPIAAPTTTAEAEAAAPAEEQAVFDVILSSVGDKKIPVIKVVREITSLGLKEAKDLVESAPAPVKREVSKEEAEAIKRKLEEVGATVELK